MSNFIEFNHFMIPRKNNNIIIIVFVILQILIHNDNLKSPFTINLHCSIDIDKTVAIIIHYIIIVLVNSVFRFIFTKRFALVYPSFFFFFFHFLRFFFSLTYIFRFM